VREKGMGLIFRIVWFDDMNVLLKSYRFGRTSGDISQYPVNLSTERIVTDLILEVSSKQIFIG
jgi:hypothetical protein